MLLILLLAISLFASSIEKSLALAEARRKIHRDDIPIPDDYINMHFYDKDSEKNIRHKAYYYQPQQQTRKIQYAPLEHDTKGTESPTKFYKIKAKPETELPDVTTNKNLKLLGGQFYYENKRGQINPLPQVKGYNIKASATRNEIAYRNELKPGYDYNNDHSNENADINIKRPNIIDKTYLNNKSTKPRREAVSLTKNVVTESYESQKIFDKFHKKLEPIRHIIQVLPALENAKIHSIVNPYYIKGSRLHLNMARSIKIAQGQNKAQDNGRLKRIRINKLKHFVPDIDELLEQKKFLAPSMKNKRN